MICIECDGPLGNTRQIKYCSSRCKRRYLGRVWKANNRDKTREYGRRFRVARCAIKDGHEATPKTVDPLTSRSLTSDNIRHCRNCPNELSRQQKMYCSIKCHQDFMSKYNAEKRAGELRFAINWSPEARTMTPQVRATALETKGNKCLRCGTSDNIEVHHIRPLCCNGDSDISNLMLLCRDCHDLWHKVFPDDLFWNKNTGP